MGLSTAERNRRKRERKKKERAEELKQQEAAAAAAEKSTSSTSNDTTANTNNNKDATASSSSINIVQDEDEVEVEYVTELPSADIPEANEALKAVKRFQQRAAAAVLSEEEAKLQNALQQFHQRGEHGDNVNVDEDAMISKRKLRDMLRPSVGDLKRRVEKPDLVEAHDITATDPDFLIRLKSVPGTVPVPRHWGRKRKYLQGKRGFEKPPFQLPAFLVQTGITELRDTVMQAENEQSAKQKNRARVTPRLGAIDVDYRTLHDAFFKHQTKPNTLTKFGDLYYEGKELELKNKQAAVQPGQPLSKALRAALGLAASPNAPPPWLLHMQRYGPPPSYRTARIPGLTAPLPSPDCQYGFHPGGWGQPPLDAYGRPLYGGNPLDPPGRSSALSDSTSAAADGTTTLVTSDGKTVSKAASWGALPEGTLAAEDEEEESGSGSDEEMEESEDEGASEDETTATAATDGMESTLPPPQFPSHGTAPVDLRKTAGTDTPLTVAGGGGAGAAPPKQLYQVLEQTTAAAAATAAGSAQQPPGTVFASEVAYAVPTAAAVPEGAESVLSKAVLPAQKKKDNNNNKRKRGGGGDDDEDDEEALGKNFKF